MRQLRSIVAIIAMLLCFSSGVIGAPVADSPEQVKAFSARLVVHSMPGRATDCEAKLEEAGSSKTLFVTAKQYARCIDASYGYDAASKRITVSHDGRKGSNSIHYTLRGADAEWYYTITGASRPELRGTTRGPIRFDLRSAINAVPYERATTAAENMIPLRFTNDALGARTVVTDDTIDVYLNYYSSEEFRPLVPIWDTVRIAERHASRVTSSAAILYQNAPWDLHPSTVVELVKFAELANAVASRRDKDTDLPYEIDWKCLCLLLRDSQARPRLQYQLPSNDDWWVDMPKVFAKEKSDLSSEGSRAVSARIAEWDISMWLYSRSEARQVQAESKRRLDQRTELEKNVTGNNLYAGFALLVAGPEINLAWAVGQVGQAVLQDSSSSDQADPFLLSNCYWAAEDYVDQHRKAQFNFALKFRAPAQSRISCVENLEQSGISSEFLPGKAQARPPGTTALQPSVAVADNGTVWVWGTRSLASGPIPKRLPGVTDAAFAVESRGHDTSLIYILHRNGVLSVFGGEGQTFEELESLGKDVIAIEPHRVGDGPSIWAVKRDGTVWYAAVVAPFVRQVEQLTGVVAVSELSPDETFFLKTDGSVWTLKTGWDLWGHPTGAAVRVGVLNDVMSIRSGGLHTLILDSDGTVWGWGSNSLGQLGDGGRQRAAPENPVMVKGLMKIKSISAGFDHSVALDEAGRVWAWGRNTHGQLGTVSSAENEVSTPIQISLAGKAVEAVAGFRCTLVRLQDGAVIGMGYNGLGCLGNASVDSIPGQKVWHFVNLNTGQLTSAP